MSLDRGATQLRVDCQCLQDELKQALALLVLANPYVGRSSTIGGQELGVKITEFIAVERRRELTRENV